MKKGLIIGLVVLNIIALAVITVLAFRLWGNGSSSDADVETETSQTVETEPTETESVETQPIVSETVETEPVETEPVHVIPENPIEDAVNYSRPLDFNDPQFTWAAGIYETAPVQTVKLPKLAYSSQNADEFNKKIYDEYRSILDTLESHEEEGLYQISYSYTQYDGKVLITIKTLFGMLASEYVESSEVYFYDLENDTELTREELYAAYGLNDSQLIKLFMMTDTFSGMYSDRESFPFISIVGIEPSSEYLTVLYKHMVNMGGMVSATIDKESFTWSEVESTVASDNGIRYITSDEAMQILKDHLGVDELPEDDYIMTRGLISKNGIYVYSFTYSSGGQYIDYTVSITGDTVTKV